MISLTHVKSYCKDYEKIENYAQAIVDKSELWICHHKLENIFTSQELEEMGIYWNVKPGELMFIRQSEHNGNPKLHIGVRRRMASQKGKKLGPHSEETKQKIADAMKGKPSNRPKRYIRCVETNEVHYDNEWRRLGYNNAYIVASGKLKTCKGLHFEYID